MVEIYEDVHGIEGAQPHYHLGTNRYEAPSHQQAIFERIVSKCRDKLTEYKLVKAAQGYKIVDPCNRAKVFFNCYRHSAGDRVKIIPHDPEFFEEVFRPLVESIEEPEGIDYDFNWVGFIVESPQRCSICGKIINEGEPILCIQNPYKTDVWEIIEGEWDVDAVDFRACLECANAEGHGDAIKDYDAVGHTIPAHDWLKEQLDR